MPADLHQTLTALLIAQLETADPASWSPPWHGTDPLPTNALTGRRYRGLNTLSLWVAAKAHGYADPRWATYRQWAVLGAQVRRGEPGSPVLFYRDLPATTPPLAPSDTARPDAPRFVARTTHVFNIAQVDDAPPGGASVGPPRSD